METIKKTKSNVIATNADQVIVVDELVMDGGKFEVMQLSQIRISKTNRKRFNEEAMQELAADIKVVGVVQPIVIRPVTPTAEEPEAYEIVAGERRFRASIMAGMRTIPAMIHTLTDLQAARIQILENLKREDPHEMEEAEGYQNLMLTHGYNADQLAAELNKSRSYVYGRLKLCALAIDVREQFLDNKFSASTALLIARIPLPALQVKAVKEITEPQYTGEPMSVRQATKHIQDRYMLKLESAPFPINDVKLLAVAGSCSKCPKRSGNQPEIFTDIANKNLCTDPDCFSEKRAANYARKVTFANKKGIPIIEGQEATSTNYKIVSNGSSSPLVTNETTLWAFDRRLPGDSTNTNIEKLIPEGQLPTPQSLLKMDNGVVKAVFSKSEIQTILETLGLCATKEAAKEDETGHESTTLEHSDPYIKRQKEDAEHAATAAKENVYRFALYKQVRSKSAGSPGFLPDALRIIAKLLFSNNELPTKSMPDLYAQPLANDEAVHAYIDQAAMDEVRGIILDLIVGRDIDVNAWQYRHGYEDSAEYIALLALAKTEGIDADQLRADLEKPPAQEVDATPFKRPLLTLKKKVTPAMQENRV